MAQVIVKISTPEQAAGTCYFNGNAYPQRVAGIVDSCADRFAGVFFHSRAVRAHLDSDVSIFLHQLNQHLQREVLFEGPAWVAHYRGMGYRASLVGILFETKSYLDALGALWGRLIVEGHTPFEDFRKGKVGNRELSGGRIINWLRASAPSAFPTAGALADVVEAASSGWITAAVGYRDLLTHGKEIRGLEDLRVPLRTGTKGRYFRADVLPPAMPDGTGVVEYCEGLFTRLSDLFLSTVRLLPSIDLTLICNLDAKSSLA